MPTASDRAVLWTVVGLAGLAGVIVETAGDRRVPRPVDVGAAADQEAPALPRFAVDVNTADWPEWAVLPGIGPALARRIVATREAIGPFTSVDAVGEVRGIGPKTSERLRPFLTLGDRGAVRPPDGPDAGEARRSP